MKPPPELPGSHPGIGFREFVVMMAALMAVNALAVDAMLPALPLIGKSLGIIHENERQWIVTAYLLGFGLAQIVYGPLSDRYGRKPVLLGSLSVYAAFGIAAGLSTSLAMMIATRLFQGIAAAATRVVTVSVVRDCYAGRAMARVMSLTFIVFLAVPILAPTIGQLILFVAPWRGIFMFFACISLGTLLWVWRRLPETLHPEYRRPIELGSLKSATVQVLTNRVSIGYTLAQTAVLSSLFGFINSVQQIFFDTFHAPGRFTLVFAGVAGFMAIASLVNSRIVERLGTRRVSHTALLGFILFAGIHFAISLAGRETIWSFALCQAAMMSCFGLAMGNFGAMAMEPLGAIAGIASSVQGFITSVVGALAGFLIGQAFDGTTVPLTGGFFFAGMIALVCVLVTERGRLFHPTIGR